VAEAQCLFNDAVSTSAFAISLMDNTLTIMWNDALMARRRIMYKETNIQKLNSCLEASIAAAIECERELSQSM
jgi:hypothetical protein